jgi:hypothetical protein
MVYASPTERQELITRLRALADFLASNPEIPAPPFTQLLVFPPFDSDSANQREIDAIASRISAGAGTSPARHQYSTSRMFGRVEYRAVAIPADEIKEQ